MGESRRAFLASGLASLSGIALASRALAQGQTATETSTGYKSAAGPFTVGTVDEVLLRDTKRDRDVPLKAYYPQGPGPYPVILFSHGFGGSKDHYAGLAKFWASHGYVSLHPSHADAFAFNRQMFMNRQSLGAVLDDAKRWADRSRDVSFVLDSLEELQRNVPELKGKLSARRIGVGGHSFGAFTTMLLAGALVDLPDGTRAQSYADPRPRAFLAMSPQGTGQQGLNQHSWETILRPMMTMTGSADRNRAGQSPTWRQQPYDLSPPGGKYHVYIDGASHFSFSGRQAGEGMVPPGIPPNGMPPRPMGTSASEGQRVVFAYVKAASLAFWDAHLKRDPKALAYLKGDSLPTASGGKVALLRK
jgi:predicted dienelactone hydrolase